MDIKIERVVVVDIDDKEIWEALAVNTGVVPWNVLDMGNCVYATYMSEDLNCSDMMDVWGMHDDSVDYSGDKRYQAIQAIENAVVGHRAHMVELRNDHGWRADGF